MTGEIIDSFKANEQLKRAAALFQTVMRSNSDKQVAWDRDAAIHVPQGPEWTMAPRLYQQFGEVVFVGYPVLHFRWVPDNADDLGGKWKKVG